MMKELQSKGCQIIDATCPDVKRVQDKAKDLAKDGYRVIIIGKADHPEVIAIKAHADEYSFQESLVFSSRTEAEKSIQEIKSSKKIGVVIQTTQLIENFKEILPVIAEYAAELKVYNTICSATFKRQQSAKELAQEVDLMVVVGSKSSANTTHLAEILAAEQNTTLNRKKTTILIETAEELENYKELTQVTQKIGVTAGASTPEYVINEVIKTIGEQNK
jgi:4-hydroxy-3-methylbut-2-enyl diphosphate reductase